MDPPVKPTCYVSLVTSALTHRRDSKLPVMEREQWTAVLFHCMRFATSAVLHGDMAAMHKVASRLQHVLVAELSTECDSAMLCRICNFLAVPFARHDVKRGFASGLLGVSERFAGVDAAVVGTALHSLRTLVTLVGVDLMTAGSWFATLERVARLYPDTEIVQDAVGIVLRGCSQVGDVDAFCAKGFMAAAHRIVLPTLVYPVFSVYFAVLRVLAAHAPASRLAEIVTPDVLHAAFQHWDVWSALLLLEVSTSAMFRSLLRTRLKDVPAHWQTGHASLFKQIALNVE